MCLSLSPNCDIQALAEMLVTVMINLRPLLTLRLEKILRRYPSRRLGMAYLNGDNPPLNLSEIVLPLFRPVESFYKSY